MSAPGRTEGLPQLHSVEDVAAALKVSRRKLERLRAAGRFPKPDVTLGRSPRWRATTITAWLADAAGRATN